jgi:hypothetical protein
MTEFEHIDGEASQRLADLADRARVTLISAGIPAFDSSTSSPRGGAAIEVDIGDDETSGVYVSWTFSRELSDEISGYLLSNQHSHPVIQRSGSIRLAMRDAIIAILNAAGLSARPADDDMHPLAVRLSK